MAKKLNQLTAQPSTPADSDVIAWGQAGGSGLAYKMTFTQLKAKLDAMAGGGDTTAPAISSRTVENATPNRIDLTYNEALDTGSVPANGDFTVSGGRTVTGVAVIGSQVRITVNTAYANGDTITVGYTPGTNKIQDVAGNDAPAITAGTSVTNNISGGYDADAQAYFDVLTASTTGFKDATNALVAGLKTDSIWTKVKGLYLFRHGANASAANHKWNVKNPLDTDGAYRLVFTGCTHNGTGLQGNGSSDYADTKFNPSTAATANSIALGAWNNNSGTANGSMIGCDDGAADYTDVQYSTLAWYSFINRPNAGEFATDPEADNSGFVAGSRTSSTSNKLWKNAAQIGSTASTANSGSMPNKNITLLARNSSSVGAFFAGELACAFIADGLNDTELGNLYSRLNTWRSAT